MQAFVKIIIASILLIIAFTGQAQATTITAEMSSPTTIDRLQVITQQINLLKARLQQGEHELTELQREHDKQMMQLTIEKTNKNLLDKVSLDVIIAKSNLASINIELTDAEQTINWLEKNVQEIENQLNVLSIFGLKMTNYEAANVSELRADATYQQKLLSSEKDKLKYLQDLQKLSGNILQFKKERYNRINTLLKSRNMLLVKQQQMKDELLFQERQNQWLQRLDGYYQKIAKIDPVKSKNAYAEVERQIFYANENANFAYLQSLIARYKDQIQQMKLTVARSNSISLLSEISDQVQVLAKQMNRLDAILKSRINVLDKQIIFLTNRKRALEQLKLNHYIQQLTALNGQYQEVAVTLKTVNEQLTTFRGVLDQALQTELSARQGLPTFSAKTLLDLGKEILLLPALAFQVLKSLSTQTFKAFQAASVMKWSAFVLMQSLWMIVVFFLHKLLTHALTRPSSWREQINSKWLSLQWLRRNFIDLIVIGNVVGVLTFFNVPFKNYSFILYLSLVWLIFKSIRVIARICLVETMHHSSGHDVKLYQRLKWMVWAGGVTVALTVFVHQLPLVYELKTVCDQVFLLFLFLGSLLLLRSWDVVPNLILSQVDHHPYLQKSIRLIGILIPILMLGNSVIGLIGYMNLVLTVSWYEGVFLVVLIGYLILRGLLSDMMELFSRLMIQHVHNGWLWTEAVLKPLDKVFRIALFLFAWAVLFILYGWDQQSPIVERLTRLLDYRLASVLNTVITPLSIIELFVVISVFYWTAKWTREFVYRMLSTRTKDMGIRNSLAILSQYSVVVIGGCICLRVLGIEWGALAFISGMFAFGVGLGLRDLANNFACGFLILLERPLRVGDIVNVNGIEGDVVHIGSRAVTVRTWDLMELVVPNAEIFNKPFTNWTAHDNIVRTVFSIKISRYDNPHEIKNIIEQVLLAHKDVLKEPVPEIFLKEISDTLMEFEIRYFVNIRLVKSRMSVMSSALMQIWDVFAQYGIKPPHPQHEVFVRNDHIDAIEFQNKSLTEIKKNAGG